MSKKKKTIEELVEQEIIPEEQQPYEIPENWIWVRLKTINKNKKRNIEAKKFADECFELYSVPSFATDEPEYVTGKEIGSSKQLVEQQDVLLCKINPRINRVWIVSGNHDQYRQLASTEWIVIGQSKCVYSKYLLFLLRSPYFRKLISANVSGVGGSLTRARPKEVETYPIALPPLNEQKRIAEKVERLLETIEEAKMLIEEAKESFEIRRAAILDKAFRGELTAKWREEKPIIEPADIMFKNIKEESSKGKKKVIEFKEVTDVPYDLPKGWKWVNLEGLLEEKGMFDGPFGSNLKTADYTESGVRVIRLENIGRLSFDDTKRTYISLEKYTSLEKHTLVEGDIIFASFISDNVRVCIMPSIETKAINKADCFCIRPNTRVINKEYLLYFLSSNICYNFLHRQIHGATRPRVNTTQLKALPIPVPPLKEQLKIVTNIQKLYKAEQEALNDLNLENSIVDLKKINS
ncbi:restriction endonuclease subunit S [Bacillus cereus]